MASPIGNPGTQPVRPNAPLGAPQPAAVRGEGFASVLRQQLETVNALQTAADDEVAKLLSGQSDHTAEVFVAARKAQVAFSLLMEIRNKLVDAYEEVKNLRV